MHHYLNDPPEMVYRSTHSDRMIVATALRRKVVGDTDSGRELRDKIADLERLLEAYRSGALAEKF